MKTDTPIYTLLGADPEFLYRLTDGIEVHGPYLFEALNVKGLERRTDGVLVPQREDEGIWVIEFQARRDPLIYHRLVQARSDTLDRIMRTKQRSASECRSRRHDAEQRSGTWSLSPFCRPRANQSRERK